MHFVKLKVDKEALAAKVETFTEDESARFHVIPCITDDDGIWVSTSNEDDACHLLGGVVLGIERLDFSKTKKACFGKHDHHLVGIFYNLANEIGTLLDYDKVRVYTVKSYRELDDDKKDNPNTLYILLGALGDATNAKRLPVVTKLRFGSIDIKVPSTISGSFLDMRSDKKDGGGYIKDDNGTTVAFYDGNKIHFLFDIGGHNGGFEEGWHPTLVAREVIARSLCGLINTKHKIQTKDERLALIESTRTDFVKHCKLDLDEQRKAYETSVKDLNEKCESLQEELSVLYNTIRTKRRLLEAMKHETNRDTELNKQFDLIKLHIPLLRSFEFTKNGISLETEMLYLDGDNAEIDPVEFDRFPIGRYYVQFERGGSPFVTNLTHRLQYRYNGILSYWDHPHVKDHVPCLGNVREEVNRMVTEDKWFGAITYVIEALQSYNSRDGWSPVGLPKWQAAASTVDKPLKIDPDKKDRIKQWTGYRHRLPLGLCVTKGDKVIGTCPSNCPLKDTGKCVGQEDGVREATIVELYDDNIKLEWPINGDKIFNCPFFDYYNVTMTDGRPVIQTYGEITTKKAKPDNKIAKKLIDIYGIEVPIEDEEGMTDDNWVIERVKVIGGQTILYEEAMPTINITGEDVQDTNPDPHWNTDIEPILPEDDELMEQFGKGVDQNLDF